jgi:hypothetical protein
MPPGRTSSALRILRGSIALAAWCAAIGSARAQEAGTERAPSINFERRVKPILESRCFSCHGPEKQKSNLRLDAREHAIKGGENGPALVPGAASESEMIRRVEAEDRLERMPPTGAPLEEAQISILRGWIDQGATWPTSAGAGVIAASARRDLWSLRPIEKPVVPALPEAAQRWARNPIDAFVFEKLGAKDLSPAPEAERRTLIRRLYLELTGLPPSYEAVEAFVADSRHDAVERVADRLLADPRHGERWARHWLDVAHFADSHGQDQDRPRPNAWPYRDYLIRAFNGDIPYARFVEQQIAGDARFPGDPDAIVATGFLAAGPWDESSLRDIREDSIDREIGRYLDRDDIVTSTASTFLGLTVGCARCHDHKFDPIPQADYYALQAVFAGVGKGERLYDADPDVARRREVLESRLKEVRSGPAGEVPEAIASQYESAIARFEANRAARRLVWSVPEPVAWSAKQGTTLKALLDRSILALGTRPERDTYTVTIDVAPGSYSGLRLEVLPDETLPQQGPGRQDNGNLHLSEIRIKARGCDAEAAPEAVAIRRAAADFDQEGWGIERALDGNAATAWGIHPQVGKAHEAVFEFEKPLGLGDGGRIEVELDQNHGAGHLIGRLRLSLTTGALPFSAADFPVPVEVDAILQTAPASRSAEARATLARFLLERLLANELQSLPPRMRVYCASNRFEPDASHKPIDRPRTVHVLERGDIHHPREEAAPGALAAVEGLAARFDVSDSADEGERRAALARWIADPANPLTWRSIVNRAWHYHFGRGIVDTPNDLGSMGGKPSHPQLLDWLAAEFRDTGGSLKALHRRMVLSSTYRQSARPGPDAALIDAENRLLSHMNRQRLDAESLRDALLQASGRLDQTMYGPPVYLFVMKPGVHVTPVADFDEFDIDRPEAQRRSIYRFLMRTQPDPFLEVFDCPDASQSAPVRGSSVSPLQALALWNDRLVARHCEHLEALAEKSSGDLDGRIDHVSQRVLLRRPAPEEREVWRSYAARHGLANLCRVLFNTSEFLFID